MAAIRAFLAIPLTTEIKTRAASLQRELAAELSNIRWTAPTSMHLTLKFFAALSEESLEKIGQIMLSVGALVPPFPVCISGLGTFPTPTRARVFWLGINGGQALNLLHESLEQNIARIGIPREDRPFTPHLTLGRHRQGLIVPDSVLQRHAAFAGGTFMAEQVILYRSRLDPAGAVHVPLYTQPLGGQHPDRNRPKND